MNRPLCLDQRFCMWRFGHMKVGDEVGNHCRLMKSLFCCAVFILGHHQRLYTEKCVKESLGKQWSEWRKETWCEVSPSKECKQCVWTWTREWLWKWQREMDSRDRGKWSGTWHLDGVGEHCRCLVSGFWYFDMF